MARVWSAPQTWSNGLDTTAANMNAQIRDNLDFLYPVIYEQVLGADTGTWDTGASSIPSTYKNLVIVAELRSSTASGGVTNANLRFNNDSGANYDWEFFVGGTGSPGSGDAVGTNQIFIGNTPLNSVAAGYFSSHHIEIPHYANTSYYKGANVSNSVFWGTSSGSAQTYLGQGNWRSTAAISRLQILLSSGNILAGSRLLVYGTF